jgi:hypothetical protein
MNVSLLHKYSLGVVAENKVMSSNEILVLPHEVLNMTDGDVKSNPQKQTIQGVDASGRNYSTSVIHDNTLKATWLNIAGDNRTTSPDVRRGETVTIWRYGDADKFYWTPMGMNNNLRKLETVRHTFSGTTDETDTTLSEKNSYFHEVSTHKKSVTIGTSKVNGEVAGYTCQIDAANGFIHIQDDAGQIFELDTKNKRFSMTNADGTQVRVDGKNISLVCSDTLAVNATNAIVFQTKDFKLTTQTMEFNISNTATFTCPKVTFSGEVDMQNLKVSQDASISGSVHCPHFLD